MMELLLDIWRARNARLAAVYALRPFMGSGSATGDGEAHVDWFAPRRIGFLATAISAIALRTSPSLGSDGLGIVQADAWSALTGERADLLGARIMALSLDDDEDFAKGCADGLAFARECGGALPEDLPIASEERRTSALWDRSIG